MGEIPGLISLFDNEIWEKVPKMRSGQQKSMINYWRGFEAEEKRCLTSL